MAAIAAPPVVSLKTILVATDFSSCSEPALHYAAALARQEKGKVILTHVLAPPPAYPIPMDAGPLSADGEEALQAMRAALASKELAGVEGEALLEEGELWPTLEEVIKTRAVDVLVIGTHGWEGVTKLLLGSYAEDIYRRAELPVITVGPHVDAECLRDGRLHRVVFATDLSSGTLHALPYALKVAQQHRAELTLVHAIGSAVPHEAQAHTSLPQQEIEHAQAQLRELVPSDINAEFVVQLGIPSAVVVQVAQARSASLIVMGLHGQSRFAATHLPWTTAHRVVCDAHCPVLTVR